MTGWRSCADLCACLDLPPRGLVCLVGAGGKTTAMLHLADCLSRAGRSVIVTTTTRIHPPDMPLVLEPDPARLAASLGEGLAPGQRLALGAGLIREGRSDKLLGMAPQALDRLHEAGLADYILAEADGARRLPLKAPRAKEPVIPAGCSLVLGVMGLSALGAPLDAGHVFGLAELLAITGRREGETIGPEDLKHLLEHPAGLFKNCPESARRAALFNQMDLLGQPERAALARALEGGASCLLLAGSLARGFFLTPGKAA